MDKGTKLRIGLYVGIAMAIIFILPDLLTHEHLTAKKIGITIISGLSGGIVAAFVVGGLIRLIANSKRWKQGTQIDTEANERILFETGANHFKRMEAVGGRLYLTNKRLVFKSHKYNIQKHELSINLSDINRVDRYKTFGIVNNGLAVSTSGNTIVKFVVEQPNEWLNQLTEKNGLQKLHL
jgi:hypothetical protein